MLILGPTGAGKSALLVYLLQQMAAVYRPRMFIIEAGGSFSLLGQHFREHGISVHEVSLHPDRDVSLPPFADALQGLDRENARPAAGGEHGPWPDDEADAPDESAGRDVLGEMEIAARVMITGGDAAEDARLSRADRLLIRNAILKAAESVRSCGRDQVITRDVVDAPACDRPGPGTAGDRRNRGGRDGRRHGAVLLGPGRALLQPPGPDPGPGPMSRSWKWASWRGKGTRTS